MILRDSGMARQQAAIHHLSCQIEALYTQSRSLHFSSARAQTFVQGAPEGISRGGIDLGDEARLAFR